MANCMQNSWQELLTGTLELAILGVQCAPWLAASSDSYYLTVEMMLLAIHGNLVCCYACLRRRVLLSLLNLMTKLQNPNSQLSSFLLTNEVWIWWQAACRTLDKNSWRRLVLGPVVFRSLLAWRFCLWSTNLCGYLCQDSVPQELYSLFLNMTKLYSLRGWVIFMLV